MVNEILKGTTTVGMVCTDGVILASERRATMGNFIASSTAKKVYQIDELIGMTTAGGVGDAQSLVRIISAETRLHKMRTHEPMKVKSVATLMSNILSGNRYYPYYVQLLMGGVDRDGPMLFSLDALGGQIEETKVVATGSGSPTAYGVLEDRYLPDISMDEGAELAVRALGSAMKRDSASGDGMVVVKITKDGFNTLTEEEVSDIKSSLT
ncbi:MAG: archaeal proteasome endopeptidase complex subunit beta [Halobacteriota archaeon]|nr:archaeal proteasome endopeptidase complex subunit beta [Halobacteriota archaeon]